MVRAFPALALAFLSGGAVAQETWSFNRDIRPLLSEYCYACHGPDENHREADLRLDQRDAAIEYGAIVPGEPDKSILLYRMQSEDPSIRMPNVARNLVPTEAVALIEQWIAAMPKETESKNPRRTDNR